MTKSTLDERLDSIKKREGILDEVREAYWRIHAGKVEEEVRVEVVNGYEGLLCTLLEAYKQAAVGKGKNRHAKNGAAFEDQPIFTIAREHGLAFLTGQAAKKLSEIYTFLADESDDQRYERARNELAGAIVYTAAAMMQIADMEQLNHESSLDEFLKSHAGRLAAVQASLHNSEVRPEPPSSPVEARLSEM